MQGGDGPAECCAVHALAEHFDSELKTGRHGDVIFIVLLENALRCLVVCPDRSCLPPTIVARGVRLKKLKAKMLVPARNEE